LFFLEVFVALRNFQRADIFNNAPLMFFSPDGGEGSGAGGSEGGGTAVADEEEEEGEGEPKSFSQEDLDRIIKDRVKGLNRDLKKKEQEQKTLEKKLVELEEKLAKLDAESGLSGGGADDKTIQGQLELQKKRFERQLQEMETKFAESEKGRLAAEEKQRVIRRDTELQQALVSAGCIPEALVAGKLYFQPQLEWDGEEWLFRTKSENLVSIAEGVAEELPKYMRPSAMTSGGSGTGTTKEKQRVALQNQLKEEEAKLHKLQDDYKRKGGTHTQMLAMRQSQLVKKLKADLASKK
jgi:hypothetical protein